MSAPTSAPRLILSPPSSGKTEFVLTSARTLSVELARQPVICLPTSVQKRSAQARLAAMGGAFGLRLFTFDTLWAWFLDSTRQPYKEPVASAQFRLMEQLLAALAKRGELTHFGAIAQTTGLVEVMRERVLELAHAQVDPDALLAHWQIENAPPRLLDIARIYCAWRDALAERNWVDRPGVGRLALEAVRASSSLLFASMTPIFFDGFDFLTELQVQTVAALAAVPHAEITFTLTGDSLQPLGEDLAGDTRFHTTRRRLEKTLGVEATPLPAERPADFLPAALRRLHQAIIVPVEGIPAESVPAESVPIVPCHPAQNDQALLLLEATQRATEARAALRWIKRAIVEQQVAPSRCALIVRDLALWRPLIGQVAAEFGVPVAFQVGAPLRDHPLIGWLEMLLDALRPDATGSPTLPRDAVVELWRSPWQENQRFGAPEAAADLLDQIARRALLVDGLDAWREALTLAAQPDTRSRPEASGNGPASEESDAEDRPSETPSSQEVIAHLAAAFARWLEQVSPAATDTVRHYVGWIGALLSALVDLDAAPPDCDRALDALQSALRGMVWTAEALPGDTLHDDVLTFGQFLGELGKVLEGALYSPPMPADGVFVGTVVDARGVPFAFLALLGLAEGEIPRRMVEDPFLRQGDRIALHGRFAGVQTEPYGIEREYFEETLARAERAILLTRPLLAENGAHSEPSPFWIDIQNTLHPPLRHERAGLLGDAAEAASLPELLRADAAANNGEGTAANRESPALRWLHFAHAKTVRDLAQMAAMVRTRTQGFANAFDGDLRSGNRASKALLARRFPADYIWSPTALEGWILCHHFYFAGRLLALEAPSLPEEGVARWQVGQIYHDVLAEYFAPTGAALSVGAAPSVGAALSAQRQAAETIPDEERLNALIAHHLAVAPAAHGFLDTPAWRVEAREIEANLRLSAAALHNLPGVTVATEKSFAGKNALRLQVGDETLLLRGVIDRLDRLPNGGYRVIDYKTGTSDYDSAKGLTEGKRLQLALYAMAVEQEEGAGSVADAFYFFVHKGEAARWSLASFDGGAEHAFAIARRAANEAVAGIRSGNFIPKPPDGGCPDYCPAAAWCWHYSARPRR